MSYNKKFYLLQQKFSQFGFDSTFVGFASFHVKMCWYHANNVEVSLIEFQEKVNKTPVIALELFCIQYFYDFSENLQSTVFGGLFNPRYWESEL